MLRNLEMPRVPVAKAPFLDWFNVADPKVWIGLGIAATLLTVVTEIGISASLRRKRNANDSKSRPWIVDDTDGLIGGPWTPGSGRINDDDPYPFR